jgi:hypothetical protein
MSGRPVKRTLFRAASEARPTEKVLVTGALPPSAARRMLKRRLASFQLNETRLKAPFR